MQNDFNQDPFRNEDNEEQQNERYEKKQEIPRWTPYEEEPRTEHRQTVPNKQPSKKRWIIPLVVVLAIMVAAITVGVVIGAQRLRAYVNENGTEQITDQQANTGDSKDTAVISTSDTSTLKETSSGKYILTDVSDIVEEVIPSVVSITSRSLVENGGYGDYWNFFFGGGYGGNSGGESREVESGIGSGTIISQNSSELLILTSYHVVEGSSSLYVTFIDGTSVDGYIKSQSDADDIAIVAVPLTDLSEETLNSIKIARLSTEEAQVGEGAIVIGNALGYGMSVTSGIISATNRQIQVEGKVLTVMQTDAAINGGNSGGCVINKNGDVIGISEAKITMTNVEGMCYAIPVSSNTELIQTLINQNGETQPETEEAAGNEHPQTAYLGIRGRDIDNTLANSYGMPKGIYIASTVAGSGAEAAGLQEGDIIVGMDNVSFYTMTELQEQLSGHNPGDEVSVIIMRDIDGNYSQMKVKVTLTGALS